MIDFVGEYGRWRENVYEGDYEIFPEHGVALKHRDCTELIQYAVIGPALCPGDDGPFMRETPGVKGIYIHKEKFSEN